MKHRNLIEGVPGVTVRVAVTDVVQYIAEAVYLRDGHPAISLDITCEENAIRYAFRVDPDNSNIAGIYLGHILYVAAGIQLVNSQQIRHFRFLNETEQSNGILMITPMFEVGTN